MAETAAQTTPTPNGAGDVTPSATNPIPADVKPVEGAAPAKQPEPGTSLVSGETPKEGTEPKPAEKPGEDIQLKLPEGVKVDEKFLGDFKGIAKELQLKGEQAQKLVDLHLGFMDRVTKELAAAGEKRNTEWRSSIEADPALGGAALKSTALTVSKAVQKFGGSEFGKAVDEMGLGNWPPLVKFLHRVGSALKDDTASLEKSPSPTATNDDEAFYRDLYKNSPGMFSK